MEDEEREKIKKLLEERTKKICATPETAREYLIRIGIYNEDGSLAKAYGGDK